MSVKHRKQYARPALDAENFFVTATPSILAGLLLTIVYVFWRAEALGAPGSEDVDTLSLRMVFINTAVIGVGLILLLRRQLRSFGNVYAPAISTLMAVGLGWLLLVEAGSRLEENLLVPQQDAILFAVASSFIITLGCLVFDYSRLGVRLWRTVQAVLITSMLSWSFFALLSAWPALQIMGVFTPYVLAGVTGFIAVRLGRNILLGVEARFLKPYSLTIFAAFCVVLTTTLGVLGVQNTDIGAVQVLWFSAGGSVAWFVLAYMRQRPSKPVLVKSLDQQ